MGKKEKWCFKWLSSQGKKWTKGEDRLDSSLGRGHSFNFFEQDIQTFLFLKF